MRKQILFLLGCLTWLNTFSLCAQQKIEVSAFYSDYFLKYVDKTDNVFDKLPDSTWTTSPYVQVRIKHHISASDCHQDYKFRSLHLFDELAPFVFFHAAQLKTDDSVFHCTGAKDMAIKVNSHPRNNKELSYSYLSLTTSMLFDNSFPQAFYGMGDMHSWYMTSDSTQENLRIEFNVDQSLFHLRCSKPLLKDGYRAVLGISAKEVNPSFYLFYLPAYVHQTNMTGNRMVDMLVENIDKEQSDTAHVIYRQLTPKQKAEPIRRVMKAVDVIDKYFGREYSPDSLYVVVSDQTMSTITYQDTIKTVFSRAHQEGKYALLLFHTEDFYEHTLLHELIHTYLRGFAKNENCLFEHYVFSEAMVEYLASYIYENQMHSLVFEKKKENMEKNECTSLKAERLINNNPENEIVVADDGEDKSWIYYDYIPYKMHRYALKTGREEEFARMVAQYLLTLDEKKSPSFDDFSSYMRRANFRNIKKLFFKFD